MFTAIFSKINVELAPEQAVLTAGVNIHRESASALEQIKKRQ